MKTNKLTECPIDSKRQCIGGNHCKNSKRARERCIAQEKEAMFQLKCLEALEGKNVKF